MKSVFAIVFCLFTCCIAHAQGLAKYVTKDTLFNKHAMGTFVPRITPLVKNEQAIPQNFYTQHLGFFCNEELKMQRAGVPVTFRLGSMDYCNHLEQKPGYR